MCLCSWGSFILSSVYEKMLGPVQNVRSELSESLVTMAFCIIIDARASNGCIGAGFVAVCSALPASLSIRIFSIACVLMSSSTD